MEGDHISVRKLAVVAGGPPPIIQGIRSSVKTNFTIGALSRILDVIDIELYVFLKSVVKKGLEQLEALWQIVRCFYHGVNF
jgi:hypothetical protein